MITRRALLALLPLGFISRWLDPFKHVHFHQGNMPGEWTGCLLITHRPRIINPHSAVTYLRRYSFDGGEFRDIVLGELYDENGKLIAVEDGEI